jgi:hypothetical protein
VAPAQWVAPSFSSWRGQRLCRLLMGEKQASHRQVERPSRAPEARRSYCQVMIAGG